MLTDIISIFRTQAREHKSIKAFYYNRNYELGSGNEQHPLLWLEDPIGGRNANNIFTNSVNFSVLFLPNEQHDVPYLQNMAFSIGLNIIERIKKYRNDLGISIVPGWSYMTLRDYYDNNSCGCRFSVEFTQANMQNLCLIDDQFDEDKVFDTENYLPRFDIAPANGCETFVNKLPQFDLKLKK